MIGGVGVGCFLSQCDKSYPERQKGVNFQQGFSCHCYVVPFSQLWLRASGYWRLQLLGKDTGLSLWHIPLQVWWTSSPRGTLYFVADCHQFKGGCWIILQRICSSSKLQKASMWHCNCAEWPARVQGFGESGSIFAMSQVVCVMAVADLLTEC